MLAERDIGGGKPQLTATLIAMLDTASDFPVATEQDAQRRRRHLLTRNSLMAVDDTWACGINSKFFDGRDTKPGFTDHVDALRKSALPPRLLPNT